MNPAEATRAGAITVAAPAKINLYLHLLGRRDDGYHLLDSLIVFLDFADTVSVSLADGLSLGLSGPCAPALEGGKDNLVLAAARALAEAGGCQGGAAIELTKRVPVAAGLGGGSADAAAALLALSALWGLEIPAPGLADIALGLGADVPVCLAGRPSFVAGIGERIVPAPAPPPAWLVLANPGVPLSTAAVFAARQGGFSAPARWREPISELRAWIARLAACRNDLEAPALALVPEVREVLATLRDTAGCLLARMSGSGATCFGLYAVEAAAAAAARRIAATRPGWWVRAAALRAAVSGAS
ncbi:MAG: 4-(cytidine 5'-diphospho)-2-C-methyl-D-erythritol kinase [Alphaproteobacteria bacterium]|nr:4-(cytidine 5'-diphospho)-2-C-methyl-D-erythritol kinase [Alphaproteobacteria bacterium]